MKKYLDQLKNIKKAGPSKMKSSAVLALIIAVLAVLWIALGPEQDPTAQNDNSGYSDSKNESHAPISVRVQTRSAEPHTAEISTLGITKAAKQVNVRAETSGRIKEILIEEGRIVKEGDIILRLVIGDRMEKLGEAKALLAQRQLEFQAASQLSSKGFRAKTQLAASKSALEAAQAAVKSIELDISHTEIRAQTLGVLDSRPVEAGDFVDQGETIGKVVDLNNAIIEGFVTERNIKKIKLNSPAYAVLTDGTKFSGEITFISSASDPKTRTFKVELTVPNPEGIISQGMTAELVIPIATFKSHLVSPSVLSLSDEGKIGVKIVDENNIVHFLPVNIIDDTQNGLWLAGLPEKIQLITVGQEFVIDGQEVKPVVVNEKSDTQNEQSY